MRCFLLFVTLSICIGCNQKTNNVGTIPSNPQIEVAKQFQTSLLDDLKLTFKVDTLGGSWGENSSFIQFAIIDSTYNHLNTYNYALKAYLRWKEKLNDYKINTLLQGSNRFSFEIGDDTAMTTIDVISYPLKKVNHIEFMIRTITHKKL